MKKDVLLGLTLLSVSSLLGATNEEIMKHFKKQIPIPGISVKITSRENISDGLDYVSVLISDGKGSQELSLFTEGDYIFPDAINIKKGYSLKEKIQREKRNKEISKIYKNEDPKNIISIGNDPKKETMVIFSDPECPFCKKELDNIENVLKKYNLKIIFTPVHEKSSVEKSALIYKHTKDLKDDKKKIEVLKKYFSQEADEKVSDEELNRIEKLRKKYFDAGVNGTPYKVKESELLK